MKAILFTGFMLTSIHCMTQSQQQEFLRSQIQKAPDHVLYNPNYAMNHRDSRAVIFYDDFSNPSNWTLTNTSTPSYDWEITNTFPSGLVSQNFGPTFNSTSGGNFAIVNSDGQGGTAVQNCDITLVNSIDCSLNSNVQLRFENYHRIFYETHTVYVSNDGVNYDPYVVNTTYGAANNNYVTSPNPQEVKVNITSTAGLEPTVWIRFNYNGSYDWFWAIDDVTVEDLPQYLVESRDFGYCDLNPSSGLGERIEHTILPSPQVRDLKFIGDYRSIGSSFLNSTYMKLDISNSSSTLIHSDSTSSISVNNSWVTDSLIWNSINGIGNYTFDMQVKYDSASTIVSGYEIEMNYNITPITFDEVFARDNNTYSPTGIWNGSGNPYILGNQFEVTSNTIVCAFEVAFAQGTEPGAVVCVQLYEIDTNASSFSGLFIPVVDNCLDGVEHAILSSDISSNNNIHWVKLQLSSPYTLQAGKAYVAAVNHYGGTQEMVIMKGGNTIRDAATVFIYDPTATSGGPWFYTTSIPMIRMGHYYSCVPSVSEMDELNNFSISPNPASEYVSLNFNLLKSARIRYSLIDAIGKQIKNVEIGMIGAGEQNRILDVSDLTDGIYFIKLQTDEMEISKRVIIIR